MLKVTPVPIFQDNYVWIIHAPGPDVSPRSKQCVIVDPGEAASVIAFIEARGLDPIAIFITHSHYDHIDGIDDMLAYKSMPVYGPKSSAVPQVTQVVGGGTEFSLWDLKVSVISVPGHMPEHVAYTIVNEGADQVFSGDVLFSSGCGRIFVGTHSELKASLDQLKSLRDDTVIYPTHEYTLANLEFALAVEPQNAEIKERQRKVRALRSDKLPSLPVTVADEKRVNPFLRCHQEGVIASVSQRLKRPSAGELETFTTLRRWKDAF